VENVLFGLVAMYREDDAKMRREIKIEMAKLR
jgi:hypothetical protein